MKRFWGAVGLIVLALGGAAQAQDANVTVPDLTGLNAPRAAAVLNAAGLRLGVESNIAAEAGQTQDTIVSQTPAANTSAPAGAAVDVQIARAPNIRLVYDDNDLTLINLSTQALSLAPLTLNVIEGRQGQFRVERLGADVDPGDCVQIWSVGRNEPKRVPDCHRIDAWRTTNDPNQHAWTQSSGAQRFSVMQNNQTRAECPAASGAAANSPLVCEFYVDAPATTPNLAYVYLAYTENALIVTNPSDDGWLRMNVDVVPASGDLLVLSDLVNYDTLSPLVQFAGAGNVMTLRQLAPGQCVRFRTPGTPDETFPQPCAPYGDRVTDQPFWTADFIIRDRGGKDRVCRAATPGRLTICIMPR